MRPAGPTTTPAFRVKALVLCARARLGKKRSRELSVAIGLGKALDDETRPVSTTFWVRGVMEFQRTCGEAAPFLHRYLIHPNNLAVWSGLLRGAKGPAEVYRKLVPMTDAPGLGLWEELEQGNDRWVGAVRLPGLEPSERRAVAFSLSEELSAIPGLFGLPRATVVDRSGPDPADALVLEARWQSPRARGPVRNLLSAGLVASVAATTALALDASPGISVVAGGLGAVVGGAAGWLVERDSLQRRASVAQRIRILALEREVAVRSRGAGAISSPEANTMIAGQFKLGRQLGLGATGAVWEATRVTDGQVVALKLLRTAVASESRAVDRLQREAEALGMTWHPNIVRAFEHGVLPTGLAYLVLERLEGETLAARIRRRGALAPEEVIRWGIDAAEALRAVHAAGIVHRDVKPENLFVHRDAEGERLKLFDFGVAHVDWAETRLTRDGIPVGTRGYAPPEQERGEDIDARADVFALGVTLRELSTGQPPRLSAGPASAEAQGASADESTRSRVSSDLAAKLDAVIDRMTTADRLDRIPDAAAVREALIRIAPNVERTRVETDPGKTDTFGGEDEAEAPTDAGRVA